MSALVPAQVTAAHLAGAAFIVSPGRWFPWPGCTGPSGVGACNTDRPCWQAVSHLAILDVLPTLDMWEILHGADAAVAFHLYLMARRPGCRKR